MGHNVWISSTLIVVALLSVVFVLVPAIEAAPIPYDAAIGAETRMFTVSSGLAEIWLIPTAEPLAPSAVVSYTTLIPYHSQLDETPQGVWNACGPAALLMLLDFWNVEDQLETVADHTGVIPPSLGGYDEQCQSNPVCTSPGALALVAERYGLAVEARAGWTIEDVRESLVDGNPIIADVTVDLDPERRGHFVVIYGVDDENQIIYYHDPYRGPDKYATWDEFLVSWGGPVDKGDPLQPEGHKYWGMSSYLTILGHEWQE